MFSLDDDDSASKRYSSSIILRHSKHSCAFYVDPFDSEITGMEQPAFFNLARSMYDYLLNCVVGLHAQNAIIIEVLEGIR